MIHFKNHKYPFTKSFFACKKVSKGGFTLIETMLATVIMGIVLTPIFLLFGTISQRMNKSTKQLYAILDGKQLLYQARQKQDVAAREFTLEKKSEQHDVNVKYALQKSIDPKSALANVDGLHRELVTIEWTEMDQKRSEQLIMYVYKQVEQKKS